MDAEFEQKIREKLGEGINPAYVEAVLEGKSIPQILEWMAGQVGGILQPLSETRHWAAQSKTETIQGNIDLGLQILIGEFNLLAFIAEEVVARNKAVDI